jgi:RNA polymerase sigma factor (TIGR02999 family)
VLRYCPAGGSFPIAWDDPENRHGPRDLLIVEGTLVNYRSDAGESAKPIDARALDELFSVTYEELRRLASAIRRGDPNATLSPTALVNEAWLKLRESPHVAHTSPAHFRRIAARAMRQVLVEAARRRRADKRGGGAAVVTFDESLHHGATGADDLLALDHALDDLARLEPRQASLVECRFFGGLEIAEAAALLDVSESTALRDWRAARAWLAAELRSS